MTTTTQAAQITRALDPIRARHRCVTDPAEPSVGIMFDRHFCEADDQEWPCETVRTIDVVRGVLEQGEVA